jgi:tRNA(Ile2)-agmatinylcytidine synthase
MTWIGIDDTDSPRGGCTTFTLTEVIRAAAENGFDLLGEPRLTRLNPNIPYKTRGNASLSARFGHGLGKPRVIGDWGRAPVRSFRRGRTLETKEARRLAEVAWGAVRNSAQLGEEGTEPAMVVVSHRLPAALYWNAVQRLVRLAPVERLLRTHRAIVRSEGSRRGLVGAAAAVAWSGAHPTFELLAYRAPARYGERRRLSSASVRKVERRYPELFVCTDPTTRRVLVAPHTGCPILYGLRASRPDRLIGISHELQSETVARRLLFRTNQGTGDHLARREVADLRPYDAAILSGTVAAPPEVRPGGHVAFDLVDRSGDRITCLAFEPTKTLPRLAASLRPGDVLRVWGGRARDPTLRLEGVDLVATVPRLRAPPNPRCPTCGGRLHSLGTHRGFRCPRDGTRAPPEARVPIEPETGPELGRYHPTPSARRHLHPRAPEPGRPGEGPVSWYVRRPRIDL